MTEKTQLAPVESRPLATVPSEPQSDVSSLIKLAIAAGQTPTELYAILKEEREARKQQAFNLAFVKFKTECPKIERRSENAQFTVTRNGRKVPSRYASLEDIYDQTRQSLGDNGLAYDWGDAVVTDTTITMSCFVSHVGGYKRSASCTLPHESKAGASPQQKYASTITYLQRYSLIAALGLTTCDEDDDGANGTAPKASGPTLTEDQVHSMEDLIVDVGANRDLFLKHVKVKALSEIPAIDYEHWMGQLERKRK